MFGSAGRANWVAAFAASSKAYRSGLDSTATWPSGMDAVGLPFTATTPPTISRSSAEHSRASDGHPQRLGLHRAGRQRHRRAGHHRRPGGESADGVTEPAGVAGGDPDRLERHAELVGDDLREHRLVALALRGQPDGHLDAAVGQHLDVRALVRARARCPRRSSRARCRAAGPAAAASDLRCSKSSQPIMSLIISSCAG